MPNKHCWMDGTKQHVLCYEVNAGTIYTDTHLESREAQKTLFAPSSVSVVEPDSLYVFTPIQDGLQAPTLPKYNGVESG